MSEIITAYLLVGLSSALTMLISQRVFHDEKEDLLIVVTAALIIAAWPVLLLMTGTKDTGAWK